MNVEQKWKTELTDSYGSIETYRFFGYINSLLVNAYVTVYHCYVIVIGHSMRRKTT